MSGSEQVIKLDLELLTWWIFEYYSKGTFFLIQVISEIFLSETETCF
jgi:hypothetical protein